MARVYPVTGSGLQTTIRLSFNMSQFRQHSGRLLGTAFGNYGLQILPQVAFLVFLPNSWVVERMYGEVIH